MSDLATILEQSLLRGVNGEGAHVDSERILDGLEWTLAGEKPGGAPDTILKLANHIIYWNGYGAAFFEGRRPPKPEHDKDSWLGPDAPASDEEWQAFVRAYRASLHRVSALVREGRFAESVMAGERATRLEWLRVLIQHTSYHGAQIVLLRRMLGAWPPPGGGDTW